MSSMMTADPRPSMSEVAAQPGPVWLFERHLRVLSDSHLDFFQERKRIEETYIGSLQKLYHKIKSIDDWLDTHSERTTVRFAWSDVVDGVEREVQTREAFLNTLTTDVVNTLVTLKETQERIRKRIKEDIKQSSNAYTDYAENALPKLRRTYLRKCQEAEDYKAAAAAAVVPPNTQFTPYPEQGVSTVTNSRSNPNLPAKPIVTAPQPLRPLDRKPSGGQRNRSPSTSGTFSEFAQHGKKQLNHLMTLLDKGGNVRETLGVRSENNALRAVRAKREADEADKEYRRGVHWLETLRLRRTKILENAYTSLESFIHDYSITVKEVLEKYLNVLMATTATETQLSEHARLAVQSISPEKDLALSISQIPRSLASLIPKPILYYNYIVGECNDLIFGVSLVDYATSRDLQESEIPRIVQLCIEEVDKRGLEAEGIYRVSGRHAIVQEFQHKIERNEATFKFNPLIDDVHAVASLMKLYLRELPEPLFRYPLQDRGEYMEGRVEQHLSQVSQMRSKIRRLTPIHRETLRAIAEHLARVAAHSEKNKMDAKNLAIVFGNVIFGEDEMPKVGDLLSVQYTKDPRMEDLILNAQHLFEDPPPSSSPPLPVAPPGETAPVYHYGSSHTKVATVPPPLPPREMDFTPRHPPQPIPSIHPSARKPVTPIRATTDIPLLPPPHDSEEPPSPSSGTGTDVHLTSQSPSPVHQSPQASAISLPGCVLPPS